MIPTNNFWSLSLSLWRFYLKIKQYSRIINFILQIELLAVTTWPWPPLLFVCLSCGLVSAPLLNLLANFSTKRPKFGGVQKDKPKGPPVQHVTMFVVTALAKPNPSWSQIRLGLELSNASEATTPPTAYISAISWRIELKFCMMTLYVERIGFVQDCTFYHSTDTIIGG